MPTVKPLGALLNAPDYADRVNLIKKIKTAWYIICGGLKPGKDSLIQFTTLPLTHRPTPDPQCRVRAYWLD